jgi:hypothetical protein
MTKANGRPPLSALWTPKAKPAVAPDFHDNFFRSKSRTRAA